MARGLDYLAGHQTVSNVESGVKGLDARCAVIGADDQEHKADHHRNGSSRRRETGRYVTKS
jgi:hypothetical protein